LISLRLAVSTLPSDFPLSGTSLLAIAAQIGGEQYRDTTELNREIDG
jgi:hypothetical protein